MANRSTHYNRASLAVKGVLEVFVLSAEEITVLYSYNNVLPPIDVKYELIMVNGSSNYGNFDSKHEWLAGNDRGKHIKVLFYK